MKEMLKGKLNKILDVLFPEYKCIFCGRECKDTEFDICEHCKKEVLPLNENNVCFKCGRPLLNNFENVCEDCKYSNFSFDKVRSVFIYEDGVCDCVKALKYGGEKYKAKYFARLMKDRFMKLNFDIDIVTFVPTSVEREKERGYNQAKLIAEEFCKITNYPLKSLLEKRINSESQVSLTKKERRENLKGAFKLSKNQKVSGLKILVIDDVYTSGATLDSVAMVLKKSGAEKVYGLTFAKGILD